MGDLRRDFGSARRPHTDAETSDELVARARAGDVASWSRLYEETFDAVYLHTNFLVGNPTLAEDITQDAFARAFTSIHQFDGRSAFATWVRGIALNLVRMHWRRAAVSHRAHDQIRSTSEESSMSEDPSLAHERDVYVKLLYSIIDQLPETLREAFILRDVEGLAPADVAAALGISTKNATVRATRGRALVREELERRGWSPKEAR